MKNTPYLFAALLIAIVFLISPSRAQIITTVAGTGSYGFSGDGGAATAAKLWHPTDMAVDASGNIYIADNQNQRLRKVSSSGTINTFAGGDTCRADGVPATTANIWTNGVDVDVAGNVYTAGSYTVRKINTSGIITTIAGTGGYGSTGDGGPATAATFRDVVAVAHDAAGNIYIADGGGYSYGGIIRKIDTANNISTVAGGGTSLAEGIAATAAGLGKPNNIAFDAGGNLYIADFYYNRIRKVDTAGIITTVAGSGIAGFSGDGGPATAAKLDGPNGIAIDASGNMIIADFYNCRIRKVTTAGIINTIAGTGTCGYSGDGGAASAAWLGHVVSVKVAGTAIFVADSNAQVIRKIAYSPTATFSGFATEAEMSIYPNPSTGSFTLNLVSTTDREVQIIVTNLLGQKVKELTIITNKDTAVDFHVPPGIYFVAALADGERIVKEITVR